MSHEDAALGRALSAYAGATSGQALDARLVRARVLQSVGAPRRRSLRRWSVVLPLAATLAASAAFAASQPALRAAVVAHMQALWGSRPAIPQAASRLDSAHAAPHPELAVVPPSDPAAPSRELAAPIPIDALPLASPFPAPSGNTAGSFANAGTASHALTATEGVPVASTASATSISSNADDANSAQLQAYRAAHRIHFDGGNAAASLAAWDEYLAQFPASSFASDARFNRTLCLVRLGRLAEARSALQPFADAPLGSYRRAEALSLLQGLGADGLRSIK